MKENMLKIVYEDNHIIVLEKPPNILSQGDNTGDISLVDMVKDYLKNKYNKQGNTYLGLVHRLDRPVGGLMVMAKTSKAASRLSEALRNKKLKRNYIAIVNGEINETMQLINHIKQNSLGIMQECDKHDAEAQRAELRLKTLACKNNKSLIYIELETGRKHQIRAQLSIAGYPILYDMRYGRGEKGKQIALWGSVLGLTHPTTKEYMLFKSSPKTISFNEFKYEIDEFLNNLDKNILSEEI